MKPPNSPPYPTKVLTASRNVDECEALAGGDFVESIITPFHGAIAECMTLTRRIHARVGYDDINEAFWSKETIGKMLTMDAMGGATSGYAKFRRGLADVVTPRTPTHYESTLLEFDSIMRGRGSNVCQVHCPPRHPTHFGPSSL